jgi:hypothetical protein
MEGVIGICQRLRRPKSLIFRSLSDSPMAPPPTTESGLSLLAGAMTDDAPRVAIEGYNGCK